MKNKSKIDAINAEKQTQEIPATDQLIEHYCIFYNELFTIINGMTQLSNVKLLNYICSHLTVQSKGTVYITVGFKVQAADALGCDERTITRAITNLKEHQVIITLPDSKRSKLFQINPLLIWKGDRQSRLAAISELGLKSNATHALKKNPKTKIKKVNGKKFEVDFSLTIKERKGIAKAIVEGLQQKHNYPDSLCKKFYEYYTAKAGEMEDGHILLRFEEEALRNNREFEWAWKLQNWQRTERPEKLSNEEKRQKKAEEQNQQLKEQKPILSRKELF